MTKYITRTFVSSFVNYAYIDDEFNLKEDTIEVNEELSEEQAVKFLARKVPGAKLVSIQYVTEKYRMTVEGFKAMAEKVENNPEEQNNANE